MNFAKDIDKLTDFTSTYRPPTEKELTYEILEDAIEYSMRPWYTRKKHILKRIKDNARCLYYQRLSK